MNIEHMNLLARGIGYKSYAAYLRSDHWREMQAKWKQAHCFCCHTNSRLDLHHTTYDHFGNEWATDLITLCRPCHDKVHALIARTGLLEGAHFTVKRQRATRMGKRRKKRAKRKRKQKS